MAISRAQLLKELLPGLCLRLCGHGVAFARQQLFGSFNLCGPFGLQLWNTLAHG